MSKAITRVQAAVVIVVIVAAIAGAAYFAIPKGPTGPTTAAVQNPDTLTVESIGDAQFLDPAIDYETSGGQILYNVYETLLFYKGDNAQDVIPWLAQSYDTSPDGLTYTFHLRSGITFSDGTPFDANAVKYSIMRGLLIDDSSGPAWMMDQVVRGGMNYSKSYNNAGPSAPNGYGDSYTQAEVDDLVKANPIEVMDPMTVVIHLDHPYAGFKYIMTFTFNDIVSPTAFKAHWTKPTDKTGYLDGMTAGDYEDAANPWPTTNMVGTGPYQLKSWDKGTATIVLARNEKYWGGPENTGLAPIPNVIIKGIDNVNTRVLDFKAGTADIAGIPVTGGVIFQFVDQTTWFSQNKLVPLSSDYVVYPTQSLWPEFVNGFVGFTQNIKGPDGKLAAFQPFADVRIRKAFTFSLNRTQLIHDVNQNFALPATQIIPPGMFGYDTSIQPTPFDKAQAKALLLDAGAHPLNLGNTTDNSFSPKNPKSVEIEYNLGNTGRETAATLMANVVNGFTSATGLSVTVRGLAWPQYLKYVRTHQAQVWFLGWAVDYVDPDDFLVPFASGSAGTYNIWAGYSNPTVTKLVDQQASILDPTARKQMISQIENLVNNDYAYIWTTYPGAYSLQRSWLHENPKATLASGLEKYNPAYSSTGYIFYSMIKGAMPSTAPASPQPNLVSILLPTISKVD